MAVRGRLAVRAHPTITRRSIQERPKVRTRSATYPDHETAQWATQHVVTANEQLIHRWLAQSTRPRLTIEASWPSRSEPVGRVLLQAMMLAGRGSVDVRAARVILKRDASRPHGFAVHATFPIYL
ncbi:RNase A-like domain-containing protein [Streptomyces carpinensis]|uniref:RNase A-like domain-containing protein n=1 Tax=Streptomyces carpinensis TaxID=66369 RepID=A0ABV1VUX6_9ACTN|nr:RNase A-like domain-containing protein [Streptomyces carpinensis]